MNPKYAVFIWSSYALALAVLLWNAYTPYLRRNQLKQTLSESLDQAAEDAE